MFVRGFVESAITDAPDVESGCEPGFCGDAADEGDRPRWGEFSAPSSYLETLLSSIQHSSFVRYLFLYRQT